MTHISNEVLQAYVEGTLSLQAELKVMEHIAECDGCAARYADMLTEEKQVSPPPDLRKEILGKTVYAKSAAVAAKHIQRRGDKRRELLAYSARVVFAMAASVLIVITISPSAQGRQKQMPVEMLWEDTSFEEKKVISNSLQKASGMVGDALDGFLASFARDKEEERK